MKSGVRPAGRYNESPHTSFTRLYLHAFQYGSTFLLEDSAWVLDRLSGSSPDVTHPDGHPGDTCLARLVVLLELRRQEKKEEGETTTIFSWGSKPDVQQILLPVLVNLNRADRTTNCGQEMRSTWLLGVMRI